MEKYQRKRHIGEIESYYGKIFLGVAIVIFVLCSIFLYILGGL